MLRAATTRFIARVHRSHGRATLAVMTGARSLCVATAVLVVVTGCTSTSHPRVAAHPSPSPCPDRSIGRATTVQLIAQGGTPDVRIQLHTAVQVVVHGRANISAPVVTPPDAVCVIALSPPAQSRTGIYFTVKPARITIAATITGVAGGVGHPLYGATLVVR